MGVPSVVNILDTESRELKKMRRRSRLLPFHRRRCVSTFVLHTDKAYTRIRRIPGSGGNCVDLRGRLIADYLYGLSIFIK